VTEDIADDINGVAPASPEQVPAPLVAAPLVAG
jgi:hypothetical protein